MAYNKHKNEGFFSELTKEANMIKYIASILGGAGAGAGGAYIVGENKRKKQLRQLADLFKKTNKAENNYIAQKFRVANARENQLLAKKYYELGKASK